MGYRNPTTPVLRIISGDQLTRHFQLIIPRKLLLNRGIVPVLVPRLPHLVVLLCYALKLILLLIFVVQFFPGKNPAVLHKVFNLELLVFIRGKIAILENFCAGEVVLLLLVLLHLLELVHIIRRLPEKLILRAN